MSQPEQPTLERVLQHHLTQNLGQKLTPHMIAGLVALTAADCRNIGIVLVPKTEPALANTQEVPK